MMSVAIFRDGAWREFCGRCGRTLAIGARDPPPKIAYPHDCGPVLRILRAEPPVLHYREVA
jgi:hypothetical protein